MQLENIPLYFPLLLGETQVSTRQFLDGLQITYKGKY